MKELPREWVLVAKPIELSVARRPIPMTSQQSKADLDAMLSGMRPWLFRLALAIVVEPNLAEDVVQDTLIRATKSKNQLVEIEEPKAWLRTILVRRAMTAMKRRRPEPPSRSPKSDDPETSSP